MPGNVSTHLSPYKNLRINNFTAGIVSQDYSQAKLGSSPSIITQQRIPSANQQLISASGNTYGVIALPNGGLLLGPIVASTSSIGGAATNSAVISGINFKQSGQNVPGAVYPVIYFTQSGNQNGAGPRATYIEQDIYKSTSYTQISASPGSSVTSPYLYNPTFPFFNLASDGTNFNNYIMYSAGAGLGLGVIGTAVTNSPVIFTANQNRLGIAVPFGGRVWFFEDSDVAGAAGSNGIVTEDIPEWVLISFTDPTEVLASPNITIGTQYTMIDYDNSNSYGAWGQIVSGEVLLVKNTGGGLIVTGDIFSPNVTKVPAIQSTNGLMGTAALTPIGLVYRALNNGVWAWDGGTTATKISANISDSAWIENSVLAGAPIYHERNALMSQYGFYYYNIQLINNFILTDSLMFFDLNTSSWWRLPPYQFATDTPAPAPYGLAYAPKFFAPLNATTQFISIFTEIFSGSTSVYQTMYQLDPGQIPIGNAIQAPPTNFFHSFWECNPIQLADDNVIEVQEIILVMQGVGELSITCLGIDGAILSSVSTAVSNTSFSKVRKVMKFETDSLVIQLGWTNPATQTANVSPIIESLSINYRERFPVPAR